jgi:cytochrome c biogenesis protein ResB
LFLVFENKHGEPKAYRSKVSVLEDNQVVKQATIAVNAPFSYGGYEFYQADYHKENLKYSGLRVVRDPGLGVVYAGMIMAALGVCFVFYVRPLLAGSANAQTVTGGQKS